MTMWIKRALVLAMAWLALGAGAGAAVADEPRIVLGGEFWRDGLVMETHGYRHAETAWVEEGSPDADAAVLAQARRLGADYVVVTPPAARDLNGVVGMPFSASAVVAARPDIGVNYEEGRAPEHRWADFYVRITEPRLGIGIILPGEVPEGNAPGSSPRTLVMGVMPGSPAAAAGLRPGDVVTEINGARTTTAPAIADLIRARRGQTVAMKVLRGDTPIVLTVTVPAGPW